MKTKIILLCCAFIVLFNVKHAYCAEITPEQHVKNFYQWYITKYQEQRDPIDDDGIYQYVDHCVVNNIRIFYKRAYYDENYFTELDDFTKGLLNELVVHKAVPIDDTTSIVPISFKWSEDSQLHFVIFVQNTKGKLGITKIVNARLFKD